VFLQAGNRVECSWLFSGVTLTLMPVVDGNPASVGYVCKSGIPGAFATIPDMGFR